MINGMRNSFSKCFGSGRAFFFQDIQSECGSNVLSEVLWFNFSLKFNLHHLLDYDCVEEWSRESAFY